MPLPKLQSILKEFDTEVTDATDLVKTANVTFNAYGSSVKIDYVHAATEIAFLKVFIAWEKFIENIFITYMTSKKIKKRADAPKSILKNVSPEKGLKIIKGTMPFPKWTDLQAVYTYADLFFEEGDSFSLPLKQIEVHFHDMRQIRNATAHADKISQDKFKKLLRRNASKLAPHYSIDMKPGEFLSSLRSKRPRQTFFQYYVRYLQTASNNIV